MACEQPNSWDYYSSGGTVGTFGTPEMKDPVQGRYLNNCSLIAAFASLAWKGKIIVQPPGPTITYSFQFYPAVKATENRWQTPAGFHGKTDACEIRYCDRDLASPV